ncbi:PilZ domain-containing protein [Novosphingobium chloroacetimidivorans]|uniref:PilZ domain-containing protein n=1 Tax=Novosphingobium chloroacetimidivorans TaxID=1428314 RepID=UPI0016123E30|nr:PilZ domain-containing protein [Novosphingobium chloroacetimidivorans]
MFASRLPLPSRSYTGRRASARLRTRLPARMVLLGGTQHCVLIDLSLNGARIQTSTPARLGDEAVLIWGSFETFGQVVWATDTHCGLALFEPITDALLLETRQLDQVARLPEDRDLTRQSAQAWAQGKAKL